MQATERYISSTFLRISPVPFYERYTSWQNWTNLRFAAFSAFFIFQNPLILLISYTFFYIIWHQIWHQNRISFFFRGLGIFSKIAGTRMNKGIVKELVGVDELFWRRYFVTYGARLSPCPINLITSQVLINSLDSIFLCFYTYHIAISLSIQNGTPNGTHYKHLTLGNIFFK